MEERPINVRLRCLSRQMLRLLFSTSRHHEIEKLIGSNGWIIAYIGDHKDRDVFQRDLEKEFGITRSTASKNVDLLIKNGFIKRQSVDYDARLKKLILEKRGEEVLSLMRNNNADLEKAITKGFSEKELLELCGFIERISDNLNNIPEEKQC